MKSKMDLRNYNRPYQFYSASIIIPWLLWFAAAYWSHSLPGESRWIVGVLGFLGLLTPMFLALSFILPNEETRKDLFNRLFKLSFVESKLLVFAFLLMPFSILTAQLISLVFRYSITQFEFRDGFTFSSEVFPVWLILLIAPVVEEFAWHSYGTDCLRNRFSLLKVSLLFAFFWGLWHLPLSFIKGYYHNNLAASGAIYSINFFLSLFPFVLIMNWLYYKSNRSILVTIIFHISAGYFNELFATEPMSKVIQTALLTILSVYLIITDKSFFINN